ncbi:MAG: amidohydrolase family protein [Candidatus Marinimicrobia bacterium]|nr:amidohydrolase family protein [Candidatus Neomarinimicrobiota bacterium]MDP6593569.1 amidohydrolase family protein [Candidatus Neomarinimicrobiota bacterium]MDP6836353.1 amidohydrolase family protein [Candidatus Neomarinimicrobiota bacterium]MDP6965925.1 amidohydrolase family protein [Candidatus Neomarinimicrobiota bacterium]
MKRRDFLKSLSLFFAHSAVPLIRPLGATGSVVGQTASVCDIHIHLLGTSETNDCFVSREYAKSLVYRASSLFIDIDQSGSPEERDTKYVARLKQLFDESDQHRYGVLLAMDGVYDAAGNLNKEDTPFYVSNDYLLSVCAEKEEFVPGASVNPHRKDALDELAKVAEQGAVLVKWIPNSQNIDPSDDRLIPFYRRLRELNLPLLSHSGTEHTVSSVDQSYGDPARLRTALEEGVKVIVAHCAAGGGDRDGSYFYRFIDLLGDYANLHGDISGLGMLHHQRRMRYLLDHPALFERMYYGSDFPLLSFPFTSPYYFLGRLPLSKAWRILEVDNILLRDAAKLQALDVPPSCLARGMNLISETT